ncbi:transcription elongation factor GreB [Acetobacter estunensis]|uniref:transcription elongation factor GreB n=1 Tax=Acetobacter estunensis TaxID=104097 RepID=UPI001C2DA598|nr:transcription elongation factor GreB [Acetobacter estunensis]MBV1836958.1 transcription elongation factor GreB [Acetobacter estunensis]
MTGEVSGSEDLRRYITPAGLRIMRAELSQLVREERPSVVEVVSWAAGNGDRSENGDYIYGKKRLREIDRRIRFLTKRVETAISVEPAEQTRRDRVFFGATVTYADESDRETTVTIVGVDEAVTERGEISLVSPVARALLGRGVGDEITLHTPRGPELIELLAISYPPPA